MIGLLKVDMQSPPRRSKGLRDISDLVDDEMFPEQSMSITRSKVACKNAQLSHSCFDRVLFSLDISFERNGADTLCTRDPIIGVFLNQKRSKTVTVSQQQFLLTSLTFNYQNKLL